jgi:hypothetical protein
MALYRVSATRHVAQHVDVLVEAESAEAAKDLVEDNASEDSWPWRLGDDSLGAQVDVVRDADGKALWRLVDTPGLPLSAEDEQGALSLLYVVE